MLAEYQPLAEEAFNSLKKAGNEWVNEKVEDAEDIVKKFTKGRITLVSECYSISFWPLDIDDEGVRQVDALKDSLRF